MNVASLPDPQALRRRHVALVAVEDLIRSPVDEFRCYGVDPPDAYWFSTGSGDDYRLVLVADDALLTAFAHESHHSPWGRDDGLLEWPGMFDGMPQHLRERLPAREVDEPLSVSACFWFTSGAWHEGRPEAVPPEGDFYDDDPGGADELLGPLVDIERGIRELVELYEVPDKLDDARDLVRAMAVD